LDIKINNYLKWLKVKMKMTGKKLNVGGQAVIEGVMIRKRRR